MTQQEKNQIINSAKMDMARYEKEKRSIIWKFIFQILWGICVYLFFTSSLYSNLIREIGGSNPDTGIIIAPVLKFFQDFALPIAIILIIVSIVIFSSRWSKASQAYLAADAKLRRAEFLEVSTLQANQSLSEHEWRCTCGRVLDRRISTCVCGVSQREIRLQAKAQTAETSAEK